MSREPCMTLTELAREKKESSSSVFTSWRKKHPLPAEEVIATTFSNNSGKKFYKRSALLEWYTRAKP